MVKFEKLSAEELKKMERTLSQQIRLLDYSIKRQKGELSLLRENYYWVKIQLKNKGKSLYKPLMLLRSE